MLWIPHLSNSLSIAVYTDIDDTTLTALLAAYDLGPPLAFKGIAEGVENSNFLLEPSKGRFVLTVFEKRAKPEDLPFFLGLIGHLAEKGFPARLLVPARDGQATGRSGHDWPCLCGSPRRCWLAPRLTTLPQAALGMFLLQDRHT